ncbi:hypothetical protein RHGRI_017228 [Rhododendron griersonianum]|uniref:Thiamine pyrophosphate enzyme central domain-containing protein n=1 Tax=Rhododendron griersonianum TaxID=479676 RepID=A0AAV6JX24_9ERIC|nr:hypothetical protein RHGRI_017228 [Rhododendron griersonianum]
MMMLILFYQMQIYRYWILLFDLETDALIKKALRGVKVEVTHRGNIRRKYRISRLSNKMGLEADVEAATAFLDKAVKPVMVGGSKLRVAKAYDAFVELADDSGYVVAVMPSAKGMFPEHHPHFIGTYQQMLTCLVGYSLLLKKEKAILVQPDRVVIANGPAFRCILTKNFLIAVAKRLKRNTIAYENYSKIFIAASSQV